MAAEVLFCGEMVILRTLLRICGAGARVRINVQTDCHMPRAYMDSGEHRTLHVNVLP